MRKFSKMTKNDDQLVSVIFPTLNRGRIVIESIEDVLAQNYSSYEIIVADQSDDDKVLKEFCLKNPKIKYLHLDTKGSPQARNAAIKMAKGDILLFFDDDIRIKDSNFIGYHVENYRDKEVGLVGGRVINIHDRKTANLGEAGRLKFWGLKKVTNFESKQRQEIDHALGGNLSVRKNITEKVGGFRMIYSGNAHLEETDFCLRVKRTGCKLIYDPRAVLEHLQYGSGGNRTTDIYQLRYWLLHNHMIFVLANFNIVAAFILGIRQFFWAVLSGIKRREYRMFKTMFVATVDGYRDWRRLR